MENKITIFFKDFFFKFNSTFLSNYLEDRLKHHKSLSELFLSLRKRILFYVLSFSIFCIFLSNITITFKTIVQAIAAQQNVWHSVWQFALWSMLFVGVIYLTKYMQSAILRDADFFVTRVQVATRYIIRPSDEFNYQTLKTTYLFKYVFAFISLIPILILYQALFQFLSGWVLIPALMQMMSFMTIGILQNNNRHYAHKTRDHYQKDMKFFFSIEKFLDKIRILAFDSIIKKQILGFSENNSFLYLKIFANDMLISGIKYCSIFIFFALSSSLFLVVNKSQASINFLSVLMLSSLISYYFLSVLKIFEFSQGAQEVLRFLKKTDELNGRVEPIDVFSTKETDQHIISFENASFIKNNQVVLHQINQNLKKGVLIAVIGSTHEERSNYLSACAGNLQQIGGKVYRAQEYEFLSKHSIIFEGTIRENIVQFNDYDQQYYQEVLKACGLNKEIELLPLNDLTKFEQNGVNFSPSFLRKVAIARVVYAKSSVNIFDDPFAELSQQDAAKIFFDAFQKLLGGTTRIFCTDRIEYAAISDDIVLCKGGKISEQGSHVNLIAQNGIYARLFYAGAENKRFEILQYNSKFEDVEPVSPLHQVPALSSQPNVQTQFFVFGEQLFEKFKQKIDKISYFMKMFFPVFVSKNFYAFFTFLTLSIWATMYSFYFVFENLNLGMVAKTSVLFACFTIIACVSFSVMLIFYKNVYATCAYIIENVSKFYFASLITKDVPMNYDWKKDHVLEVTGKFYNQLLNFLIIGLFCLSLLLFASTLPIKLFTIGVICVVTLALFVHTVVQSKFFYEEENARELRHVFQNVTRQFFDSFQETQSKSMRAYLLEKVHAKLYGLYFSPALKQKKQISFFKMVGFYNLWQNYDVIETMIATIKSEPHGFKPKMPAALWPSNGVIQFQDVKFNSNAENAMTFTISPNARFIYTLDTNSKKSIFIEKLRLVSPIVTGEIRIDGEDLSLVSPTELRRRIGYVAQSTFIPFLSIRDHLDPYAYYDDGEIWEVLNKVGLSQHVALLKQGLSTQMEQVPQEMHWSGEVLLFGLARCILNQNKIICIDHMEASEDVENKICNIIEFECKNCTIIFSGDNEKFKNLATMSYPEGVDGHEKDNLQTISSIATNNGDFEIGLDIKQ